MRLCFDLDGVICSNGEYEHAIPYGKVIGMINELYKDNEILIFTARGSVTGIDWRNLTEKQLEDWGVKYHELIFGKPEADIYIDDKGVNINDFRSIFT